VLGTTGFFVPKPAVVKLKFFHSLRAKPALSMCRLCSSKKVRAQMYLAGAGIHQLNGK
jgi:hypothetical protein